MRKETGRSRSMSHRLSIPAQHIDVERNHTCENCKHHNGRDINVNDLFGARARERNPNENAEHPHEVADERWIISRRDTLFHVRAPDW